MKNKKRKKERKKIETNITQINTQINLVLHSINGPEKTRHIEKNINKIKTNTSIYKSKMNHNTGHTIENNNNNNNIYTHLLRAQPHTKKK